VKRPDGTVGFESCIEFAGRGFGAVVPPGDAVRAGMDIVQAGDLIGDHLRRAGLAACHGRDEVRRLIGRSRARHLVIHCPILDQSRFHSRWVRCRPYAAAQ
jgi:hypothetical protein